MKNFLKKSLLIFSFLLFLASSGFANGFKFNKVVSSYYLNKRKVTKDNSELCCTTYANSNEIFIEIQFKKNSPTAKELSDMLYNSISSIDSADSRLDSIYDTNMYINYIFLDKDGSRILSATYID